MNETIDALNQFKQVHQKHKAGKRAGAPEKLTKAGIQYVVHNEGTYLVISGRSEEIDFWPGTGKWKTRDSNLGGYGIESLIEQAKR